MRVSGTMSRTAIVGWAAVGTALLISLIALVWIWLTGFWLTGPWEGLDVRRRQAAEHALLIGIIVVPAIAFGWAWFASKAGRVRPPTLIPVGFIVATVAATPAILTFVSGGRYESLFLPVVIYTVIGLPAIAVEAAGVGVLLSRIIGLLRAAQGRV